MATTEPATLGVRFARAARGIRWYVRALMGADAYERYLAHQARVHPGAPVLGERDFWRAHQDAQDVQPGQRCC